MIYFTKYIIVGIAAMSTHLAILATLIKAFHFLPLIASSFGFVAASILNYGLQRTLVFSSDLPIVTTAGRYVFITSGMLAVNAVLFALFYSIVELPPILAQATATLCVFIGNFFCNRHYTFSRLS
jgi:putative flippase GtrA